MQRPDEGDGQSTPAMVLANEVAALKILNILGTLELFTPRVLVNDTHLTHRANHSARHRTIAHMIIAVFLISLMAAVGQCYLYYQVTPTADLKRVVLALYGVAYLWACLALYAFKARHCSTSKLSNSYAVFALIMTLGIHTLTGFSMTSPIVPLYFFIPAWAFLTCSSRSGVLWSMTIAGVFVVVTVSGPLQQHMPNIIPADDLAAFRLGIGLCALALIAICLYAHQSSFLALTAQLDEDRLRYAHKARHDPLTGLANREQFDVQLQQALDDVARKHQYAGLIYIDLNDFKAINDTHGHQVGDNVLQIVARRIDNVVRDSDTTARIGGDEFGIVLPNLKDRKGISRIVTQLEETLVKPMHIDDITLVVSGSVGMAIAPENGRTAGSLTRHADRDMYDAKSTKARLTLVRAG